MRPRQLSDPYSLPPRDRRRAWEGSSANTLDSLECSELKGEDTKPDPASDLSAFATSHRRQGIRA